MKLGIIGLPQSGKTTIFNAEQQYLNGEPLTAAGIIAGRGQVETLHRGGVSTRVRVTADEPVTLQFYTYEYPGWQVYLNSQPLTHRYEPPYGLVTVDVPAGAHELRLQITTLPRTLGAIISGLALVALIVLLLFNRTPPTTAQIP